MIKRLKYLGAYSIMLVMLLSLSACKSTTKENEENTGTETVAEPQTEAEYRTAIANLGTDKDSLELCREYYLDLRAMDVFTEADYLALSSVYESLGDTEKMRETLIDMHRLYPSKENVQRISDVVVEKGTSDTAVSELVEKVRIALENEGFQEINELLESEAWQQEMQDTLVGVCRKTAFAGQDYVAQIASDEYETEIVYLKSDNSLMYYKSNQFGVIFGNTSLVGGAYDGTYEITYYDTEGAEIKTCKGTFASNISVGEFVVEYDGTAYTGNLGEKGTTLEEQKQNVTESGGVIYAYNGAKNKYLYEENCTVDTLIIDYAYLGLPIYEEW